MKTRSNPPPKSRKKASGVICTDHISATSSMACLIFQHGDPLRSYEHVCTMIKDLTDFTNQKNEDLHDKKQNTWDLTVWDFDLSNWQKLGYSADIFMSGQNGEPDPWHGSTKGSEYPKDEDGLVLVMRKNSSPQAILRKEMAIIPHICCTTLCPNHQKVRIVVITLECPQYWSTGGVSTVYICHPGWTLIS